MRFVYSCRFSSSFGVYMLPVTHIIYQVRDLSLRFQNDKDSS